MNSINLSFICFYTIPQEAARIESQQACQRARSEGAADALNSQAAPTIRALESRVAELSKEVEEAKTTKQRIENEWRASRTEESQLRTSAFFLSIVCLLMSN